MTYAGSQDEISNKRTQPRVNSKLEKNLWAYAAAATAAGVSMLASAPPAEAEIVYTPANTTLHLRVPLDLNHDGVIDYYLRVENSYNIFSYNIRFTNLNVCHVPNFDSSERNICESFSSIAPNRDNVVQLAPGYHGGDEAAALAAGATIGSSQRFVGTGHSVGMGARVFYLSNTKQNWFGPWLDGGKGVKDRYLGLKFKIDGEFHFGWARITVATTAHHGFKATLTGYAYETVANKSIRAGQTSEVNDVSYIGANAAVLPAKILGANSEHGAASLGMLALGADGLSIWRREESCGDGMAS